MKYVLIKNERLGYLFATKMVNRVEKTVHFQMFSCQDSNAIFCTEEDHIRNEPQDMQKGMHKNTLLRARKEVPCH